MYSTLYFEVNWGENDKKKEINVKKYDEKVEIKMK